jgi:hypothetical protein
MPQKLFDSTGIAGGFHTQTKTAEPDFPIGCFYMLNLTVCFLFDSIKFFASLECFVTYDSLEI